MNGGEFIAHVKHYAKQNNLECRFDPKHGKGSHGRLWLGQRFTTVGRGELGPGVLNAMLKQLGIKKEDF